MGYSPWGLKRVGHNLLIKQQQQEKETFSITHLRNTAMVPCSVMSDSAIPWTVAHQAPLSMRFPRQEYWSGLPFSPPGDLPDPEIEFVSPALQQNFLPLSH